ncbi:MAG: substrate-binding domain-containing protein [Pseudomonadota bacterium]
MTKSILAASILLFGAQAVEADTIVLVTHAIGTEGYVQILEKAARDAGEAVGVEIQTFANPSGDLADMARTIEAIAAQEPDGLVVTLPDASVLGPALRNAVETGIPLVTINSGLEFYKDVEAITHVGQDEYVAGLGAGERAKVEGVTKPLCLIPDQGNNAFFERCRGYFEGLGVEGTEIETSYDVVQIRARTAAALNADPEIDGVLAPAPVLCATAAQAVGDLSLDLHLSCFDLSEDITSLIRAGDVAFTVDQQLRLQGYLPVIYLNLYNTGSGLVPSAPTLTGPAFVDAANVDDVAALAGVDR